ncbi:17158_t:CDS:2, partial [Gigaspora margarita]
QELKEKLYTALRSKAEINDLSEKLLTKYLEQEKDTIPRPIIPPPPRLTIAPPPPELIIVILPKPSILPPQHHPTQDLDKEHLILIINAEIEATDIVNDPDYDPDKEYNLDNYMWFGA